MADTLDMAARHSFGSFTLDAAFSVPLEGTTAIFGPSGSGKTTLLRILAGLTTPSNGHVRLNQTTWLDTAPARGRPVNLPAHKRPVGLVFQDGRLFPHLSVGGNLEFAARRARTDAATRADTISALDLAPLLERRTADLSGGEAQRVAIARTLLSKPRLLLLDEPMSGLDLRRKAQIMPYLSRLSSTFGVPTLLVSHALDEVAQLAARMVVIERGQVVAIDDTEEILNNPALQSITGRFEAGSLVSAKVIDHAPNLFLTNLALGAERISMPMLKDLPPGEEIRLRIRARDVAVATERPKGLSIRNCLNATISAIDVEPDTAFAEISLICGPASLRARITRASVSDLELRPGQEVYALIKSVSFDRRGLGTAARAST